MTTFFDSLTFRSGVGLPPVQDGAQLQRSLLSQLERQWLDDWAVANQLNTGAAAAAAKQPAERPATPTEAGKHMLPGVASMPIGMSAAMQRHSSTAAVASSACAVSTVGQNSTLLHAGSARPQASTDELSGSETDASWNAIPCSSTAPISAAMPAGPASSTEVQVSSASHATAKAAIAASEPKPQALVGRQCLGGMNGLPKPTAHLESAGTGSKAAIAKLLAAKDPESQQTAAAALEPSSRPSTALGPQSLNMGVNAASITLGAAKEESNDSEPSAPARGGKALANRPEEAEPNPRFLRLRELNSHEAIASLRDTDLNRPDSRRVAQGLARALMEAGYERVQVVVNGVIERQGESKQSADATEYKAGMAGDQAAIRPNTRSGETQYGD